MSAAETRDAPELDEEQTLREDLSRLLHMIGTPHPMREIRAYVAELEARWPDSEQVRHWAYVLAPPVVTAGKGPPPRPLDKDDEWLRAHGHEYPGCWMAIYEGALLAASPDLDEVMDAAQRAGAWQPLIFFQAEGSWVR
jgi:hypothetical protein